MKRQNELIEKYPEFFEYLKDYKGPIIPIQFGFEIGDGWYWLLSNLMDEIHSYCKLNNIKYPDISQIKEKFGGLRFEYYGGDNLIDGMVHLAERLSYKICEECGTTENVTTEGTGWILTLCKKCRHERERRRRLWMFNSFASFHTWVYLRYRKIRRRLIKTLQWRTKNTG